MSLFDTLCDINNFYGLDGLVVPVSELEPLVQGEVGPQGEQGIQVIEGLNYISGRKARGADAFQLMLLLEELEEEE